MLHLDDPTTRFYRTNQERRGNRKLRTLEEMASNREEWRRGVANQPYELKKKQMLILLNFFNLPVMNRLINK